MVNGNKVMSECHLVSNVVSLFWSGVKVNSTCCNAYVSAALCFVNNFM